MTKTMTKMTKMKGRVPFCAVVAALVAVALLGFVPSAEALIPGIFSSARKSPGSKFGVDRKEIRTPSLKLRNCNAYPLWYSVGYLKNGNWNSAGHFKIDPSSTDWFHFGGPTISSYYGGPKYETGEKEDIYYRVYSAGNTMTSGVYENNPHGMFCMRADSAYTHVGLECANGYYLKNFRKVTYNDRDNLNHFEPKGHPFNC